MKKIIKTAAYTAVFYLVGLNVLAASNDDKKNVSESSLDLVKRKVIGQLIQKQKKQALVSLDEFILNEKNKDLVKEAKDFKLSVAKKFLTKEAQEAYEMSLNLTLENVKESKKNNDECLAQDPENLDCLIQKIRLLYRQNPNKNIDKQDLDKINKYFSEAELNWVKMSLDKNKPEFKNINFSKKEVGQSPEDKLIKAILELDKSVSVKNAPKTKELLALIEKEYKDWPDLIYFKQNINLESAESKTTSSAENSNLYQAKCKNLSKTISRKYRYDFDLCARGNL